MRSLRHATIPQAVILTFAKALPRAYVPTGETSRADQWCRPPLHRISLPDSALIFNRPARWRRVTLTAANSPFLQE